MAGGVHGEGEGSGEVTDVEGRMGVGGDRIGDGGRGGGIGCRLAFYKIERGLRFNIVIFFH